MDPEQRGRQLVRFRLWGQSYEELPTEPDEAVHSTALGVSLRVGDANLWLRNLVPARTMHGLEEYPRNLEAVEARLKAEAEAAQAAQARADAEAEAQRQVEMRNAELEAFLRRRG